MSALRMKNTSESDPHSYEVTQLQIKPRQNSEAPTGFEPMTNSHLTCFQQGFIAQLIEQYRTSIAEVMGSNTVGASEFFLGFICNCFKSYFITARITFTCTVAEC